MQVLFNRSILSILSDALNFARHWIRSNNTKYRFSSIHRLNCTRHKSIPFLSFFFFPPPLSHEYNERDVLHNLVTIFNVGKERERETSRIAKGSIDPRFKKKKNS